MSDLLLCSQTENLCTSKHACYKLALIWHAWVICCSAAIPSTNLKTSVVGLWISESCGCPNWESPSIHTGFFQLFAQGGGGEMRLYGLLGVKCISVCKACDKQGGRGRTWEVLILDLLLDAIWCNLGLFSHEHNLPFIVSIKFLYRLELIYI